MAYPSDARIRLTPNVDVLNERALGVDLDVKMHVIVKDDDIIVDHISDVTTFKHVSELTISAVRMECSDYTVSNTHGMSPLYLLFLRPKLLARSGDDVDDLFVPSME